MALDAKVIFFDKSTNTSVPVSQPVTGIGFQPKALIFFTTDTTSHATYNEGAQFSIGFSVGSGTSNNKCMYQRSNDAVARSECSRGNTNSCIGALTYAATAALSFTGAVTSLDSDGFTISWTTNDARAVKIGVIALGGSSLTNAFVGTGTVHNVVTTKAYTGVGFQPDCIFTLQASTTAFSSFSTGSTNLVFGAATSSTAANNICFGGTLEDNQTTMDTSAYLGKGHCTTRLPEGTGTINSKSLLSSFNSDGFTLNWDDADSSTTAIFAFLALKGGNYDAHSFTIPTTATTVSKTGLSFQPSAVWFASVGSNSTNDDTSSAQSNSLAFGAADGTNECAVWSGSVSAAADATDARISKNTKCLSHSTPAATATSSTLNYEADLTTLNSDGWTMTFSQGESLTGTINGIAFAFGPAGAVGPQTYNRAPTAETITVADSSLTRQTQAFRSPSADTITVADATLTAAKVKSGVPSVDSTTITESSLTRLLSAARTPSADTTTVTAGTSTRQTQAFRSPSADSTTITDASLTRNKGYQGIPSADSTTVSDSSLARMLSAIRVPGADTTALTENIVRSKSQAKVPSSDTTTVVDATLTRALSLSRSPSTDSTTVVDSSTTRMLSALRVPTADTISISDFSLTRMLSAIRTPSADTVGLSETVDGIKLVAGIDYTRSPAAENTTVSDGALTRLCSLLRVPSTEIVNVVESALTRILSLFRTPASDTVVVADQSLVRTRSVVRGPATDPVTVTDSSLTRMLSAFRSPSSDTTVVTDSSLVRILSMLRSPSADTVALSESVTGLFVAPGQFNRSPATETVTIAEQSLARMLSLIRTPTTDSSAVTENLQRIKTVPRVPSADSTTVTDSSLVRLVSRLRVPSADTVNIVESSLVRLLSARRTPTPDTQTVSELLSGAKVISKTPATDTVVVSETAPVRVKSAFRSISESATSVIESSLVRLLRLARAPTADTVTVAELASVVQHTKNLQETVTVTEPVLTRIVTAIRNLTDITDVDESLFFQTWHRYVFDSVTVADQLFIERQALSGPVTYAVPDEVRPLLGNLGQQRTDPQIELAIDAAYDEINTKTNRIPPNDWKDTDHNFGIVKKLTRYIAAREMAIGIKDYDVKPLDMEIEHLFNDLLEYDTTSSASQDIVISSSSATYAASESGLIWSLRYRNLRKSLGYGENDTVVNPNT